VDDSAMMRAMIRRVAENGGVDLGGIYEAANGKDALAVLERERIHVLFTDINMPEMTGPELLREIQRRGSWADLISVVVSTDGSDARLAEMRDVQVSRFVSKPFPPEVMRDVLVEALARV
jgi:two-component system chemotaxis response regulator CheY